MQPEKLPPLFLLFHIPPSSPKSLWLVPQARRLPPPAHRAGARLSLVVVVVGDGGRPPFSSLDGVVVVGGGRPPFSSLDGGVAFPSRRRQRSASPSQPSLVAIALSALYSALVVASALSSPTPSSALSSFPPSRRRKRPQRFSRRPRQPRCFSSSTQSALAGASSPILRPSPT